MRLCQCEERKCDGEELECEYEGKPNKKPSKRPKKANKATSKKATKQDRKQAQNNQTTKFNQCREKPLYIHK